MTIIYRLCFAFGLFATGGEVINHGDQHAANIKKLAAPLLLNRRPDKGIREIPVSELAQLPIGIQRIQN